MGIKINNSTLHSLLFADDHVLFAQDQEDTKYMLRNLNKKFEKWGLKLNYQKTQYMCVDRDAQDIRIENKEITSCTTFKYLGSLLNAESTCKRDIKEKVIMRKTETKALQGLI